MLDTVPWSSGNLYTNEVLEFLDNCRSNSDHYALVQCQIDDDDDDDGGGGGGGGGGEEEEEEETMTVVVVVVIMMKTQMMGNIEKFCHLNDQ